MKHTSVARRACVCVRVFMCRVRLIGDFSPDIDITCTRWLRMLSKLLPRICYLCCCCLFNTLNSCFDIPSVCVCVCESQCASLLIIMSSLYMQTYASFCMCVCVCAAVAAFAAVVVLSLLCFFETGFKA